MIVGRSGLFAGGLFRALGRWGDQLRDGRTIWIRISQTRSAHRQTIGLHWHSRGMIGGLTKMTFVRESELSEPLRRQALVP